MPKQFSFVRAVVVVAAAILCRLAFENRPTVVSGCDDVRGDSPTDSTTGEAPGCQCGEEPVSRYVNRTDVIKADILRKMRMLNPPNASAQLRHLPDIPLLHSLIEQANVENDNRNRLYQNDYVDDDDDHVMAMTILALSQPGGATFCF